MKMRKRNLLVMSVGFLSILTMSLSSCGNNSSPESSVVDFGSVTIQDIELGFGKSSLITPEFSKPEMRENLTYSFDGDSISITKSGRDYIVKGLVEGTQTTVKAVSEHFSTSFKVTVSIDYGTVTIPDIEVDHKGTATIEPTFSKPSLAEPLSYTFTGQNISIENGIVTGLVGDSITVVSAQSAHFNTSFEVKVGHADATFSVDDTSLFEGYFLYVEPKTNDDPSLITYSSSSSLIRIDGHKITGITKGIATVTATKGDEKINFKVTVKGHNEGADSSGKPRSLDTDKERLEAVKNGLSSFDYDEGELVLFAGDSFMDERWFLVDFYTTRFVNKNAYTVGISSSRASQWIYFLQNFIAYQPKAIVLHVGTNDYFDGSLSVDTVAESLKTIYEMAHKEMPNTTIYWWTIEQRIGLSYANPNIKAINNKIYQYAEDKTWLKVIDTYHGLCNEKEEPIPELYGMGGQAGNNAIHPSCPWGYDVLLNLTYEAGLVITDKKVK
ncbi:MAG: SGNH/GDSL hydrolase family protein [Bacilli bacterium]|nr:SGNH/GDSL hydrolase family protein [Bacilli bacterium]